MHNADYLSGLGNMGLAMAKNLQNHMNATDQPALHYTNRTMARGEPLRAIGGIPCESISILMSIVHVAFCSVINCLLHNNQI